jgi:DNA repair protein RecO
MAHRTRTVQAVVLSSRIQGEADLRVTLLCYEVGLLRTTAKNALRSQKRFMGALFPATAVEALLGTYGGHTYVEEALVEQSYPGVKARALPYAVACYALESIAATHPESVAAQEVYPLLREFLDYLDADPADLPLARLAWDMKLCLLLGLPPGLEACTVCSEPVAARAPFDGQIGGVLCAAHDPGSSLFLTEESRSLLDHLGAGSFQAMSEVPFKPRDRRLARTAIDQLMTWHLPLELRTLRVLEQLSHMSTHRLAS